MSAIHHLTVLGSGVLGGQIAWQSAYRGKAVVIYNRSAESLDRCRGALEQYAGIYRRDLGASADDIAQTWARLSYSTDLAAAVAKADLVIETVPEIPEVKCAVYRQLAPLLPAHTLLATNSSTFLPRDFAADTGRPEKYCSLHYANMIWIMNVVEIMAHRGTATETLRAVTEFSIETGMLPVPVQKEQNGYVLNTWLVALLNAAQTLVTNGVSTPEDVDRTYLKVNAGASMGPMAMCDMIGMKTVFDVLSHWGQASKDRQMCANADYLKTRFLDRDLTGMQTGQGYYRYPDPAYQRPGFLAVPPLAGVEQIVELATLK